MTKVEENNSVTAQPADNAITERFREQVKELLDAKKIECFIGYEKSFDGTNVRPAFIYNSNDTGRLILNDSCVMNLTKYLLNRKGKKTGIVVRPCSSRSINILIGEKQLNRDDVVILGAACESPNLEKGKSAVKPTTCLSCNLHMPVIYDYLVTPEVDEKADSIRNYIDVEEFDKKTIAEKVAFWQEQFSRCIRCYACRAVCPGCYCSQCFADSVDPEWIGIKIAPSENEMWHAIRAFHLAGRCIGCNSCEQVCPVNIPLSLLNRKMDKEVVRLFNFQTGMNSETTMPLANFEKSEKLEAAI